MNSKTKGIMERLENVHWFANAGLKDIPDATFVANWLAAVASFASSQWENVQLDALNILGQNVLARSQQFYNQWNNHVIELKPVLDDLIKRKSDLIVRQENLPIEFIGNIYADLLGAAMEAEYSDIVAPGFYTNVILDCYLKGHFPCGWEGDFPKGRLIVY